MKQPKTTRRDFVLGMGVAAGAGSLTLLGCPDPSPSPGPGPGPGPGPAPSSGVVVRRDVMSPDALANLDAYRAAVSEMKTRPASDPTSWQAQAQIHNNSCPHGNAFFLPWHRAYLHYFEQVCRAASGDPSFALPYWNWTTQRSIPAAFWSAPLNDSTRSVSQGGQMPASAVGQGVINGILGTTDFETFASGYVSGCTSGTTCQRQGVAYGSLEGTPHNQVHGRIGGNMGNFMSPLDPIFWLHHCNVDRLWMEWNKTHANGTNTDWRAFVLQGAFVDGGGASQSMTVEQTFDNTALGYRYDTQPESDAESTIVPTASTVVASTEVENIAPAQPGQALHIPVELPTDVRDGLMMASDPTESATPTSVRLSIRGVSTPGVPVAVNVFVGAADAPASADSPHFVRSFGFFPAEAGHEGHAGADTFLFDIGDNLAQLAGAWDAAGGSLPVHVQTVPLHEGAETAAASVTPKSVRVEIVQH